MLGKRIVKLLKTAARGEIDLLGNIDLRDLGAVSQFCARLSGVTHLIHLAAVVPVNKVSLDIRNAYEVNVNGTANLYGEVLKRFPKIRSVLASSSHVYGSSKSPISESDPLLPLTQYGRTKLAAEFVATDFASSSGASLCVARIFSMYSHDQEPSFLYPSLRTRHNKLVDGELLEVPGWNNIRDFLPADTVANLVINLLFSEVAGPINVGSGKAESVGQFATRVLPGHPRVSPKLADESPSSVVADVTRLKGAILGGLEVS